MPSKSQQQPHPSLLQTYLERATVPGTSPLAAYFLKLMAAKKSNLCVSADVTSSRELLALAEEVGDHICLLKTHADIIHDFGHNTAQNLQAVAKRKGFLIFEDRKFGDIGNTVQMQYTAGPLQIVRWANIVNAHIFPGPAIVTALAQAADDAVAAYNTSVETQISGPPVVHPDVDSEDVPEEPLVSGSASMDEQDGDCLSSADEESSDEEEEVAAFSEDDGIGDLNGPTGRRLSSTNGGERKFSVVSVSTTISTKTEQISPQPTPLHHRGLSHGLEGPDGGEDTDVRRAVRALGDPPMARSLLLFAQMSSKGNLMGAAYAEECLRNARTRPDFVMGFIAQTSLNTDPSDNFITMTPGVNISSKGDALGQQYNTPEYLVGEKGTDVVIVGRGIYGAQDRKAAAEEYRTRAWKAYEARVAGH
ncbi:Orotidine 5'-phosphate decarboxylase-like protein [Elsinoe fawcettii]|nr:Orotidine 5'-phosphate decarboxylase-like protein [Elsinoe fawcettii]